MNEHTPMVIQRSGNPRPRNNRRGATMVAIAFLSVVLLVLASFAINVAYIELARARTQIVADAAVRAANATYLETRDKSLALGMAQQMAQANPIDGTVVPIAASDLEFGLSARKSKNSAYQFQAGDNGNSVRLTTQAYSNGTGNAIKPLFPIMNSSFEIRPKSTATHTQTTLDVAVIVDRSGSMRYSASESSHPHTPPKSEPPGWSPGDPVAPNSRWLDLVASVQGFCDELEVSSKIEKVAICSYASDATCDQVLDEDYSLARAKLDAISWEFYGGATAVGDGILEGLTAVSHPKYCRPWATNALVLMSDGNHNTGTDPIVAATQAALESIPIYTVSFSNEANQDLMKEIADMTGGTHYHAVDAAQLNEAFRQIAQRLPSMLTE